MMNLMMTVIRMQEKMKEDQKMKRIKMIPKRRIIPR